MNNWFFSLRKCSRVPLNRQNTQQRQKLPKRSNKEKMQDTVAIKQEFYSSNIRLQ